MKKRINIPSELYLYLDDYSLNKVVQGKLPIVRFANGERERVKIVLNNKNKKAELEIGVGFSSYMLSTSLNEKNNDCSYIKIINVKSFIETIRNEISRFGYTVVNIHMGNCIYNDKIVDCTIGSSFDLEKELGLYGSNSNYKKMMNFINECCEDDVLFSEEKNKLLEEEYRIIWDTNKEVTNNLLIDINKVLDYVEIYRKERIIV